MTDQSPPIGILGASNMIENDEQMTKPNLLQRLLSVIQRPARAFAESAQVQETDSRMAFVPDEQRDIHDQDLAYADEQLEKHGDSDSLSLAPGDLREETNHVQPMMGNEHVIRPDGVAMAHAQPAVEPWTLTATTTADSVQCDSCREEFRVDQLYRSACSHTYCESCLEAFIRTAMADESKFPPRCCKQELELSIPPQIAKEYSAKLDEFGTPIGRRVYCQQRTCSKFIPQHWIVGDIALCYNCGKKTCAICKAAPHGDADCPLDAPMLSLLALAYKNGYQRCYNCRRLVELNCGCNKISEVMSHTSHLHRPS
jgi:hypothetical protein